MKKKIMIMIPTLGGGGAEKILVDVLNNIDLQNLDITLILLKKKGIYISKLRKDIKLKTISKNNNIIIDKLQKILIKFCPKAFNFLFIREKYDIEVAYLEGLASNLVANSINKKSKKISWVHCDMSKYNWTKQYYYGNNQEKSYSKFDDIVFVSNKCKDGFIETFPNNKVDKHIIYNPIIDRDIIKKSLEHRVEFSKFTVVSVGSLSKVKGFDRLIRAFSEISKRNDINLNIIGEGAERVNLEALIDEHNLQNKVKLLGYLENPYPYIRSANLIVSSSYSEAYPTILLESIILEKAILATNVDGNNEVLDFGETGMLCESNIDGLVKGIENILSNKTIINLYEQRCLEKSKQLNYKKQIKKIESLLLGK